MKKSVRKAISTTISIENYNEAKKKGLKFSMLLEKAIRQELEGTERIENDVSAMKLKISKLSSLLDEQVKRVYTLEEENKGLKHAQRI